ncbi:MAG: hypothetical protein ACFNZP_04940 [Bifidobacterium dentium]|uniref:hypothetical protein n=1 Tax=Bifidobacterium moukalabense TaxID=1333651 RepID=UPI0010F4B081|nr:hypothetical protein [Bifidobacterium moukalabense]
MKDLRLIHCVDYDKFGVPTTRPELLRATRDNDTITIGIGADPLTRKEFAMTAGEARRLADWIRQEIGRKIDERQ